jgi:hypothetical protein
MRSPTCALGATLLIISFGIALHRQALLTTQLGARGLGSDAQSRSR